MILGIPAWLFWLICFVIFLIIEGLTFNMTTIWFAAGSLLALVAALFNASVALQLVIMVVASAVLLVLFVLLLKPRMHSRAANGIVATNADRIIGKEGLVLIDIDPVAGSGQIKVVGQIWSAVGQEDVIIPAQTKVIVKDIQGVKAVVEEI